jgi:transposase-like protein
MTACPRCCKEQNRIEYQGREDGKVVWTVYRCNACNFTWRDTEPPSTIDYDKRDPFFRVDADNPGRYPVQLPLHGY